jgi:hypothetical protein
VGRAGLLGPVTDAWVALNRIFGITWGIFIPPSLAAMTDSQILVHFPNI